MIQGTVLWFNPIKGFGFAAIEDGKHIFLHYSNFSQKIKNLNSGDEISFEIVSGEKGLKAKNISYVK